MARIETGFVEAGGGRLYVETAGSGAAVIFLHGFSLDARMWDDQVEAFAPHYRVVRYDLRGFGRSDVPTGPYSPADDLKALMRQLDISRAHLVGLSLGGGVAVDFALAYPDSISALVPVDLALGGYRWSAVWDESMKLLWKLGRSGDVAGAQQLWLKHPLFAPALAHASGARLRQMVQDYSGWHWLHPDPGRGLEPPAAGRLAEIQAPTLVVIGEHDLPDFHAIADLLHKQIRGARKAVLPGAGHMANMEAPEQFNEVVLNFLEEIK
jgi:pimeloyl-ACP methyl ester carboxylesterase